MRITKGEIKWKLMVKIEENSRGKGVIGENEVVKSRKLGGF
ncbi:MAG: hypothetical protein XD54_0744 [Thermococcus sibiricus]|uniref:Uncharacterized protein n=1 Tax=Thermococcus sibiricus TaxID=172049 RepID=A0A101EMQ7_9EURY|nr:MAG: hypothetical protein XD54_0744 [Thermococcus sibiricus]